MSSLDGPRCVPCRVQSGVRQAVLVFVAAATFNLPRWFEFAFGYDYQVRCSIARDT